MTDAIRHKIVRRVPLRKDLKPMRCLAGADAAEVEWLVIAHVTDNKDFESFDLVFLRRDGAAIPWMGFETLKIAKDQAHSFVGVEYVEWEACSVEITNADSSISWDRALPGTEQAACI